MNDAPKQIPVQILDKEYLVACLPHEEPELLASAHMVDTKMREIRNSGKVVGSERIAVITSLNMAHDLVRSESGEKGYTASTATRLRKMQKKIDSVLTDKERQLTL